MTIKSFKKIALVLVGVIAIVVSVRVATAAIKNKIEEARYEKELEEREHNRQSVLDNFRKLDGMWKLASGPNETGILGFLDFNLGDGTCETSRVVDVSKIEPHLLSGSFNLSDDVYTISDSASESYVQLRVDPDQSNPVCFAVKLSFKSADEEEVETQSYFMTRQDIQSLDSRQEDQYDFLTNGQIIDVLTEKEDKYQKLASHMEYIEGCQASLLDDENLNIEIPGNEHIKQIRRYTNAGVYTTDNRRARYYMIWTTSGGVDFQTVRSVSNAPTVVTTANGMVTGVNRPSAQESIRISYGTSVPEDEIWNDIKQSGYSGSTDGGYCVKVIKLNTLKKNQGIITAETHTVYGLIDKQIIAEYKDDKAILSRELMSDIDDSEATVVKTGKSPELIYELKSNGLLEIYHVENGDIDSSRELVCEQLKSNLGDVLEARVHEGVFFLEERLFANMKYMSSVQLPSSLIFIGKSAFEGCTLLKEIVLPDTLDTIADFAFFETGLETVVIPDSVKYIKTHAFTNCVSLTDVQLPNNLQHIGDYAFAGCDALRVVNIPESVVEMGNRAFSVSDEDTVREITVHESILKRQLEGAADSWGIRSRIQGSLGTCNENCIIHYDGSDFDELSKNNTWVTWSRL